MKKHYFSCVWGIIKQGKLYATAIDCTAIWKVDFQRRKVDAIRWLDESGTLSSWEYVSVCQMGDSLVLVPARSDYVALYNIRKDTLTHIRVAKPKIKTHEIYFQETKFGIGFSAYNNAYLLGSSYPAILKINVDSGQMSYLDAWVKELQDMIPENDTSGYFAHCYLMDGENVYIPGRASGTMFGLNLLTDQVTVYAKHSGVKMLHGIVRNGGKIWILASMNNRESLFLWSPENGYMDEIIIEDNQSEDIYWWSPMESDGYIYLFQMNRNAVYKVNMEKGTAEFCKEIMNAIGEIPFPDTKNRLSVILVGKEDEKILFHTLWNRKWFIYHTQDQSIESFQIEISDEEYEYRYWNGMKIKQYITEGELPLKDFLEIVVEGGVLWTD